MALARVRERELADLRRPRAVERGAIVEPQLGDPIPRLAALVRRRACDQAHPVLPEVRELLRVGHVLVDPPAMEALPAPRRPASQQHHDLDHWARAPPSMTISLPLTYEESSEAR